MHCMINVQNYVIVNLLEKQISVSIGKDENNPHCLLLQAGKGHFAAVRRPFLLPPAILPNNSLQICV